MKKYKNTKKKISTKEIKLNFLYTYFENFKNKDALINKYLIKLDEYKTAADFSNFIKIENPVHGLRKYWLSRGCGWSKNEAKEKRVIIKNNNLPMLISTWINKVNPKTNNFYTANTIIS